MRKTIILCVLLGTLIYGWSVDFALSPQEKFNLAFPPSAEVTIALEDTESLASTNNIPFKSISSRYDELLAYRYHTCIKGLTLSRLDSLKKVKQLPIQSNCLEAMDNMLLQHLGMRRISLRLSQPALRPQVALDKNIFIYQPSNWSTAAATFSAGSGIAVLAGEEGASNGSASLMSVDIKAGEKIVKLGPVYGADIRQISLSPNGRIAAVPVHKPYANNEMVFLDTETGNILGRIDQTITLEAWLPKMSAALLKHNTNNSILIADFLTGEVSPYEMDTKRLRWGAVVSLSSEHVLVGTDNAFYLAQNERTASGIKSTIVKEFYPKQTQYSPAKAPIVMMNGNVAIFTMYKFLARYALDDGTLSQIETYPILDNKFEKIDDERLLTKLNNSDTQVIFNLKDLSVSKVIANDGDNHVLSTLNDGQGFQKLKNGKLWVGNNIETTPSQPLASLIAEKKAEDQVNLMLERAQSDREIALFGIPVDDEPQPEMEQMPRRINPTTGHSLQGGAGKSIQSNLPNTTLMKSSFLNSKMPTNTRYEFVGVKNAKNVTSNEIQVTIQKTDRPIFLFLSSCTTVNWKIIKLPGSRLIGVFQQIKYSGQPFSSVNLDNTEYSTQQSLRIGNCAFDKNSPEYKSFEQEILEKDGKRIEKFHGTESGLAFSVGN